jgi:hypothetical protein
MPLYHIDGLALIEKEPPFLCKYRWYINARSIADIKPLIASMYYKPAERATP